MTIKKSTAGRRKDDRINSALAKHVYLFVTGGFAFGVIVGYLVWGTA